MNDEQDPHIGEHPVGTLVIIVLFGLFFALGWLAMFFGVFLPRGPLTH